MKKEITSPSDGVEFSGPTKNNGHLIANFDIGNLETQKHDATLSYSFRRNVLPLKSILSSKMIFDFKSGKITLGERASFCKPTRKLRYNSRGFRVAGSISGTRVWLYWDTGSTGSILDENWVKKVKLKTYIGPNVQLVSGSQKQKAQISSYFIAENFFRSSSDKIYFVVAPINKITSGLTNTFGILGYNFIKKYKWYFDLEVKKYCFVSQIS